jgi:hypothetical protein
MFEVHCVPGKHKQRSKCQHVARSRGWGPSTTHLSYFWRTFWVRVFLSCSPCVRSTIRRRVVDAATSATHRADNLRLEYRSKGELVHSCVLCCEITGGEFFLIFVSGDIYVIKHNILSSILHFISLISQYINPQNSSHIKPSSSISSHPPK